MNKWNANIINDPDKDFNLMIEISYEEFDVAAIKNGKNGLELQIYSHNKDIKIPVDWLFDLLR